MGLNPVLTKHHAMLMYGGMEIQFNAFLTWELDGSE